MLGLLRCTTGDYRIDQISFDFDPPQPGLPVLTVDAIW